MPIKSTKNTDLSPPKFLKILKILLVYFLAEDLFSLVEFWAIQNVSAKWLSVIILDIIKNIKKFISNKYLGDQGEYLNLIETILLNQWYTAYGTKLHI